MIQKVNATGLSALLKNDASKDILLLDVREGHEFETGHLRGAVNIPLSIFEKEFARLPRDRLIVVICRIGHRSKPAAKLLAARGYGKVICLRGGMFAWKRHMKDNLII